MAAPRHHGLVSDSDTANLLPGSSRWVAYYAGRTTLVAYGGVLGEVVPPRRSTPTAGERLSALEASGGQAAEDLPLEDQEHADHRHAGDDQPGEELGGRDVAG